MDSVSPSTVYRLPSPPCYIFAGGGTGGHLTPGLAVADELRRETPGARIVFAGSGRSLEKQFLAERGFEQCSLPVESTLTARRNPLKFLWNNWRAYRLAGAMLDAERPVAVIGLGGFASVPVVLAATRRGIPTLILEQNVVPGRATRFLSRRASAVCISFAETQSRLHRGTNCILTGNPVRREILSAVDEPRRVEPSPTLLILGGSQGATAVNQAVLQLIERERTALAGWRIVHQTGAEQAADIRFAYARLGVEHVVEPFFPDVAALYRQATLVISRAGATTLAELACCGCPAIAIPYPRAADNHQLMNAQAYESAGAARVVVQSPDPASTAAALATALVPLCQDAAIRESMRQAMRTLSHPEATRRVIIALQAIAAR